MKKKITVLTLCAMLLALCLPADAQQAEKVPRIGFLDNSTASGSAVFLEAFRQELTKLGWIEGKNITIEYRFAEQKPERLPELAWDLVRLKVDLIVATGGQPALAAKGATTTIPIVMATSVGDPVALSLVASLGRPGGNVTGLSSLSTELGTKRLEILKDAVPKLAPSSSSDGAGQPPSERAQASGCGTEAQIGRDRDSTQPQRFRERLQIAKKKQVDAIMTISARRFFAKRKRIVELAGKYRLPAIYPDKEFVEAGGLMSYGADSTDLYRRAAVYVDKILKGAKPADLPVQQATKFEFVINLKAAKQIGVTVPPRVLERADKVIK